MAVNAPAVKGRVENVTVRDVDVAAVTAPTAPLLNTTVLLPGVGLKFVPLIVTVVEFAARLVVVKSTVGRIVATCTEALLKPFVVTTAFNGPPRSGRAANVMLSEVVVAEVMMPTAPPLNVTELLLTVESKPKPLMVRVVTPAASVVVLAVIAGTTEATLTAAPLLRVFVVTTAVRLPTVDGFVENVTVSNVRVAVVTVPTTPLLKTTVLLAAVRSNPNPAIVIVDEFDARDVLAVVTTGITVATCTAAPLATPLTVTDAVRLPAEAGRVENVTVRLVRVAEVTVPTAPLLKTTTFRFAVGSNANPVRIIVLAFAARLVVEVVITGMMLATCNAAPLVTPLVVTEAVSVPTPTGRVENVTVRAVAVADVTAPTAPLLNVTTLLAAVVEKPKPLITIVDALAAI